MLAGRCPAGRSTRRYNAHCSSSRIIHHAAGLQSPLLLLVVRKMPFGSTLLWYVGSLTTNVRELAMFNLAIDSKLRACDLTRLRVQDICDPVLPFELTRRQ